jgi:hypothetical protein
MSKAQKLKKIAQKIDVIDYLNNNPTSSVFKRIVKHQRAILEKEDEEAIAKSAYKLKHQI